MIPTILVIVEDGTVGFQDAMHLIEQLALPLLIFFLVHVIVVVIVANLVLMPTALT